MAEFDSSAISIDLDRIAAVCEEEWLALLADMDIEPVPERQDLRGFLLNWVAVFAPEAFPSALSDKMAEWMDDDLAVKRSEWRMVKRPYIGATLFALTGSPRWLRIQLNNFDNGGSQLRSFYHQTLALVAPRLNFDEDLIARLEAGLRNRYFVMSPPLVLYAVSQGDAEEKLANLRAWQATYPMNTAEEETVARFLSDEPARNPLQAWLLRNSAYVALRFGSQAGSSMQSVRLPIGLGFSEVFERIQRHPLMAGHVRLERTGTPQSAA
ncbi:MAG: hypothetical protein PW792_05125 [Acidobacteriaceae bacterium]|nr:hypothetical protein [Acidobacteriaceae bacterium]